MSAYVRQEAIGDPLVLEVIDREEPHAGPGQVRIRARAAGLNPIDWKLAAYPAVAAAFGVTAPTGFGSDVAGVIDEVGPDVSGYAVGDRVFGSARGRAVAEHVVFTVGTDELVRTPDGLDDTVAGALPIAARTAAAAVFDAAVREGDTVLIGGAAGGVGVFAVQLALQEGAVVIATASEHNHGFLRGLGAIPTVYGEGLAARVRALAPQGVDAAIDLQGTETVDAAAELGVPGHRMSTISARGNPHGAVATGGLSARPGTLERIAAQLADGTLVLPIETFALDRIQDAVALQRSGHVRGKLVIRI